MFDRIKILFWGVKWTHADVYYLTHNYQKRLSFQRISNPALKSPQDTNFPSFSILGLEIEARGSFKKKIAEFLKTFPLETVYALYFVVKKKNQASFIVDIIKDSLFGGAEVYGIDPDGFFSLVPLNCSNHRLIEKYILGLKNEISIKGIITSNIKHLLINLNLSAPLYKKFVVISFRKNI